MFDNKVLDYYHHRCSSVSINREIITLQLVPVKYPEKSLFGILESIVKRLRTMQLYLRTSFQDEIILRDKILEAISNMPEYRPACLTLEEFFITVVSNIRGAIGMSSSLESKSNEIMFINRRFHHNDRKNHRSGHNLNVARRSSYSISPSSRLKKC